MSDSGTGSGSESGTGGRTGPLVAPWSEGSGPLPGADPLEQRAADLFRQVEVPVRFNPGSPLLTARPSATARWRSRGGPRRLALLLAAALAGGGGVVLAARAIPPLGHWLLTGAPPPSAQPVRTETALPPAPSPADPPPMLPDPVRPTPIAAPEPTPVPSVPPAPTPPETVAPPAAVSPAPPPARTSAVRRSRPSALAEETRLLGLAFAHLHRRGDAEAALAELEGYSLSFPRGLLGKEAASIRVEALLQLGRRREALSVLRAFPFGPGARDRELRLLRGELAAATDCARALVDFAAVLRSGTNDPLGARALQGQKVCRARLARPPQRGTK